MSACLRCLHPHLSIYLSLFRLLVFSFRPKQLLCLSTYFSSTVSLFASIAVHFPLFSPYKTLSFAS
jgi:hypothetical protein